MDNTKRKTVRSTSAQIRVLVDYMCANPLFAAGEFAGLLGAQQNETEWCGLATTLENYGPKKTVAQWKHTWRDLRKRAREEGGRVRLAHMKTGNNLSVPVLTEQTNKILNTIGHESATGMTHEEETGLGDDVDISIPLVVEHYEEVVSSYPNPGSSTAPSPPAVAAQQRNRARRARARPQNILKIFVEMQKENNKILENLKTELQRSNDLRERQLQLLQSIAENLERFGHE